MVSYSRPLDFTSRNHVPSTCHNLLNLFNLRAFRTTSLHACTTSSEISSSNLSHSFASLPCDRLQQRHCCALELELERSPWARNRSATMFTSFAPRRLRMRALCLCTGLVGSPSVRLPDWALMSSLEVCFRNTPPRPEQFCSQPISRAFARSETHSRHFAPLPLPFAALTQALTIVPLAPSHFVLLCTHTRTTS